MTLLLFAGGFDDVGATVTGPHGATVAIEFSPTTNPMDTPVWVDITGYVRFQAGVTTVRGRSSELDEFQAGTASLVLGNRDRRFDPSHAAGPYYGNLKALRRFRVRVEYGGTIYTVFSGFCLGWPQVYDLSDNEATVPVSLVDGFGLLALATLFETAGFTLDSTTLGVLDEDRLGFDGDDVLADMLTGERIEQILDAVGWAPQAIDAGLSTVTGDTPTGSLLSYLQQVARSDDGFFYMAGDGTATFLQRTARQTVSRISTSQATFDDDGTDLGYSMLEFQNDLETLYNDVRRTGSSGDEQSVQDDDSIDSYFRRTHSETLLVTEDAVAQDLAALFLDRYSEPLQRVPQITVPVGRDPATLFPAVLSRELLDRVTVRRTPMGVGSVNSSENLVERITHRFDTKNWETTFALSPGFITDYFTLDSSTLGVLDEDRLGG